MTEIQPAPMQTNDAMDMDSTLEAVMENVVNLGEKHRRTLASSKHASEETAIETLEEGGNKAIKAMKKSQHDNSEAADSNTEGKSFHFKRTREEMGGDSPMNQQMQKLHKRCATEVTVDEIKAIVAECTKGLRIEVRILKKDNENIKEKLDKALGKKKEVFEQFGKKVKKAQKPAKEEQQTQPQGKKTAEAKRQPKEKAEGQVDTKKKVVSMANKQKINLYADVAAKAATVAKPKTVPEPAWQEVSKKIRRAPQKVEEHASQEMKQENASQEKKHILIERKKAGGRQLAKIDEIVLMTNSVLEKLQAPISCRALTGRYTKSENITLMFGSKADVEKIVERAGNPILHAIRTLDSAVEAVKVAEKWVKIKVHTVNVDKYSQKQGMTMATREIESTYGITMPFAPQWLKAAETIRKSDKAHSTLLITVKSQKDADRFLTRNGIFIGGANHSTELFTAGANNAYKTGATQQQQKQRIN